MTEMVEVTFLRQKVFHNGTSMVVKKAGETGEIPARQVAQFVAEKAIEEPSKLDTKEDGARDNEPFVPPALTGKNKAELAAIAAAEGVVFEQGATNAQIVDAIEAARVDANAPPA